MFDEGFNVRTNNRGWHDCGVFNCREGGRGRGVEGKGAEEGIVLNAELGWRLGVGAKITIVRDNFVIERL